MDNQDLIRSIQKFAATTTNLESILKELSKIETFKDRTAFAEKHLEHLSSGSSRIIYLTPDHQVLKLAKNERGIAQNKVEAKVKSPFVNETTKADPNGIWKLSPYRDKITEKEFEALTKTNFKDFASAIDFGIQKKGKKPDNFDQIAKSEIYKAIIQLNKEHNLLPGDLTRISSWGKSDKHPVLLDAGLTRKVYDDFYTSKDHTPKPKT
jgi:hypothetical protein